MALDAYEQYLLELINRARLDPLAEVARFNAAVASGAYTGTNATPMASLNDGLAPGTISSAAKQVLAPNEMLNLAAAAHSLHMLAVDLFDHSGIGDGTPGTRATAQGYAYNYLGENISWTGTTGTLDIAGAIDRHQYGLFKSAGHRDNMLDPAFREAGLGRELGEYTSASGTTYNASMLTEMFGYRGSAYFLTGVVYNDSNGNDFYSIGEGVGGVVVSAPSGSAASEAAGGYALAIESGAAFTATIGGVQVALSPVSGNVKLDLIDGDMIGSSASLRLVSGASGARLYGNADLDATGTAAGETLTGNAGDNYLSAGARGGADVMAGLAGNDRYRVYNSGDQVIEAVGEGNDRVYASVDFRLSASAEIETLTTNSSTGTSAIDLTGNTHAQTIVGNAGNNILHTGGGAADVLKGLGGNDIYRVFNSGDVVVEGSGQGSADTVMAAVDYTLGAAAQVEVLRTNGVAGTSGIDLTGNRFAQNIHGNSGHNRLDGKSGHDVLSGWAGRDTFVFSTALGSTNIDRVTDFSSVNDVFELSQAIFSAIVQAPGQMLSGYFKANAAGVATDANDRIVYDTDGGQLYYDADGNGSGARVRFAELDGAPVLHFSDFVIA